jgi:hypothetical protein
VESDAEVIVLNRNSALPGNLRVAGALANGCGAWFAVVYAHTGDALDITQTNGAVVSPAETVQVQ